MISIQDFLKIGDRVKEKWGRQFYKHVDFCGLEPVATLDLPCESTPKNSMTFATTGGDGVHFGVLTNDKELNGSQPIVMTVPIVSKNVILADTLEEFLGLGFYNGWFPLEQLVYDFNKTIDYYSVQDNSLSIEQNNFLMLIKDKLKIRYSPLIKERLEMLGTQYNHKLIVQTE